MRGKNPSTGERAALNPCSKAWFLLAASLSFGIMFPASAANGPGRDRANPGGPRVTSDSQGSIPARDGQVLHMAIDLGNVVIHNQNSGKIDYHVHLETSASEKHAKQLLETFSVSAAETSDGVVLKGRSTQRKLSGRLWVSIEVTVPRNYSVDVATGGGNVAVDDTHGHLTIATDGGNIYTGNIDGAAHLSTAGGHIVVKNVGGEMIASTGGGHITAGMIAGSAALHTTGGHIRVGGVGGSARLERRASKAAAATSRSNTRERTWLQRRAAGRLKWGKPPAWFELEPAEEEFEWCTLPARPICKPATEAFI
jgi:hypothetical protein